MTSRRTFLAWAGALSLPVVLAPLRWWSALVEVAPRRELALRLGGVVADGAAAARVGRAYLAMPSAESSVAALVGAVARSAAVVPDELATASRAELRRLVAAAIDADYENGRTVLVDGWLLSRTEASVCALAALRRDER